MFKKLRKLNCLKKALLAVLLAIGFLSLIACDEDIPTPPAFQISELTAYSGNYNNLNTRVGIAFVIKNTGTRSISHIELKFDLSDGTNPLPDDTHNEFELGNDIVVDANAEQQVIIKLDAYFWYQPTATFYVNNLYVSRVVFSDGTSWEDPPGQYKYPYTSIYLKV